MLLTPSLALFLSLPGPGSAPTAAGSAAWSYELRGGVASCSAVLVSNPAPSAKSPNPWLLTARHCLEGSKPTHAENPHGHRIQLERREAGGSVKTRGAFAFDLSARDISLIEVVPDMVSAGAPPTGATIAGGGSEPLYVFGWSSGFRRVPVGETAGPYTCDDEGTSGFIRKGRLLFVTGNECVGEGDSGGAVATDAGRVIGIVRAKNRTMVDVTEVVGHTADLVPAFLSAISGACAGNGRNTQGCFEVMKRFNVKGNPLAGEALTFAALLIRELDSIDGSWFAKLEPRRREEALIRLTGLRAKAAEQILSKSGER